MAANRPGFRQRPSRLVVAAAFGVAIAATAALVAAALLFRGGNDAPSPTPAPVVDLEGIPQREHVLGSPDAKVTLIEYADPQCPACRLYSETVFPTIVDEYVRPGKVRMQFRGYPFLGPDSVKALRFLLAAGRQDRLWQLQEALYRNQGAENEGWVTDELLRRLAGEIPGLDVERLFADAASEQTARQADAALAEAQAAGIPGTPTFFIQIGEGKPYFVQLGLDPEQFRASLDDALQG